MSPVEPSNPTTTGPGYSKIAKAQEKKNPKRAFMYMIELLKEEINKSVKEVYENTNKQ